MSCSESRTSFITLARNGSPSGLEHWVLALQRQPCCWMGRRGVRGPGLTLPSSCVLSGIHWCWSACLSHFMVWVIHEWWSPSANGYCEDKMRLWWKCLACRRKVISVKSHSSLGKALRVLWTAQCPHLHSTESDFMWNDPMPCLSSNFLMRMIRGNLYLPFLPYRAIQCQIQS